MYNKVHAASHCEYRLLCIAMHCDDISPCHPACLTHWAYISVWQITINGFSKAYAMTGYRLGYMCAPVPICKMVTKLQGQITSCASSIAQHAALAALRNAGDSSDGMSAVIATMRVKRDHALGVLRGIGNVTCETPEVCQ
jgi:aspartate/methionine/tyrosine aminotransferase